MPATTSTISAILKEIYEGPVREQLNNDTIALKRIERSSAGISSEANARYVTFPVHYGRNSGIGGRKEMGDLPKPGNQATAAARVMLKFLYGAIQLSGQTMELADSNTDAFIAAVDLEMDGLKTDLAVDLNRQVYGTGVGNFAQLSNASTSGATVTSGMNFVGINQVVDLWKATDLAAGNPLYSSVTITSVSDNGDDTGTIGWTISGGTPGNVDTMTLAGSANSEWTGLQAIVSASGQLYNIDPSNVDQWRAHVDTPGSLTPLSEGRIIKNVDKVRKSGGKTSLLLTSLGVRRSYFGLLQSQRQFIATQTKNFDGGFSGLGFVTDQGEIPLVADSSAPSNILWGLSEKNLKVYRDKDWSFLDRDGSIWKIVPGSTAGTVKDAYMAYMHQYSELGTDRRNVHFKMEKVTEA